MKTLYISDLDGTLLRSNQKTSEYTNEVINHLVENGMCFSYATARSSYTSCAVTKGLTVEFPIIVYNGAFVKKQKTGELIVKNFFAQEEAKRLVGELVQNKIYPIVYAFIEGAERFSYLPHMVNSPTEEFLKTRRDERDRPCRELDELREGELFYISCIGEAEKLYPFYEKYKSSLRCLYQKDIYSGDMWLEIMPREASKANAARQLADMLGCGRIAAFGDGRNDLDLFRVADESYAVENAVPELKAAASAVIASNDDDGVARWLIEHVGGF